MSMAIYIEITQSQDKEMKNSTKHMGQHLSACRDIFSGNFLQEQVNQKFWFIDLWDQI